MCKIPIAIVGEKIWYRPMDKYKDRSKVEANWEDGVWLGISRESNEILVGTKNGVMRAYALKQRPADERWDEKQISDMRGTPQRPNPEKVGLHIPTRIAQKQ